MIDIWKRIAIDSESAANRFYDMLYSKFRTIGSAPGIGIAADQVAPNTRKLPVGEYIIYYRPSRGRILITRVLHGKRLQKRAYPK